MCVCVEMYKYIKKNKDFREWFYLETELFTNVKMFLFLILLLGEWILVMDYGFSSW